MKRVEELLVDGLKIYQDDELYRFTSDSVLLSRFAVAKKNEIAADFCAGVGIVGIHFYALNRRAVKSVTLFEMQKPLYDLSIESIALNGLGLVVDAVNCRLQDIPSQYTEKFTLILANPPYRKVGDGARSADFEACRSETEMTFDDLAASAARTLRFGGRLCFSHLPERLPELFVSLKSRRLEPKRLRLVTGGGKIYLALVEAVKGGKPGLKIDMIVNGEK